MVGISDAVVIGIVLGLVFAAVSYYLYSRVIQLEKKVGLMENILLDLKVTTEQTLLAELSVPPTRMNYNSSDTSDTQDTSDTSDTSDMNLSNDVEELNNEVESEELNTRDVRLESSRTTFSVVSPTPGSNTYSVIRDSTESTGNTVNTGNTANTANTVNNETVHQNTPSVNYEANTYKELLSIARQKGVTGGSHMTKSELIAALRRKDSGEPVKTAPAAWSALLASTVEDGLQAELLPAEQNTDGGSLDDLPLGEDDVDSSFVQ